MFGKCTESSFFIRRDGEAMPNIAMVWGVSHICGIFLKKNNASFISWLKTSSGRPLEVASIHLLGGSYHLTAHA